MWVVVLVLCESLLCVFRFVSFVAVVCCFVVFWLVVLQLLVVFSVAVCGCYFLL